jgi:hypothetical protein
MIAAATPNAIRTEPGRLDRSPWRSRSQGSGGGASRRGVLRCVLVLRRVQRTGDRSDADQRLDFLERGRESVALDLEVVASLEVQPESFAGPEVPREA